jgi:hypothetical protein
MRPGHFLFSLDVELAWGVFDSGGVARHARDLRAEAEINGWLLGQMAQYGIPGTWALVGRLMLGPQDPDPVTPSGDWRFPAGALPTRGDPLWYAPGLLEQILESGPAHEIGTHTFSHLDATDPRWSQEAWRQDLLFACQLHERYGLKMRSIVYPRNRVAHLEVLRELGVIAYRGREVHWYDRLPVRARRALTFGSRLAALAPRTYPLARAAQPPVNLPASMFLFPREGARKHIPAAARDRQALSAVRQAAARGEIAHLWLHPYNLASDPTLRQTCEAVFAEVARQAEAGALIPITMGELADLQLSTQLVSQTAA